MTHDATLQSWQELDNPDLYEVRRGVPIFRAHRRKAKDADGKEFDLVVTDDDLPVIARNMAALQANEGVPSRINDGHVKTGDAVPEAEQPALLGFAKNPRFGHFGPRQTPCVLVDAFIKRDKLAIAKNRPFRSAEYYPNAKLIRGVALLLRDPQLDLGIVTYVGDERPYLYAMENHMPEPEKKDNELCTPEEQQNYEKMYRYFCSKGYLTKNDASVPAKPDELPVPNNSVDQPQLYAKLEAAEKRIAVLIQEQERQKCAAIIDKLKVDFKLDADTEINRLLTLSPAERDKHIAYIKANHAPQDEQIQVYSGHVEGGLGGRPTTEDTMKKAVTVATKKGIDYDAALELVKAGKV